MYAHFNQPGAVSRFLYEISGLTAVTRNITVFWYVMPYSLIDVYRHGERMKLGTVLLAFIV
jgi:hypothetical protein